MLSISVSVAVADDELFDVTELPAAGRVVTVQLADF